MSDSLSLSRLRRQLGSTWLLVLFGIAYGISQVTILIILGPIDRAMLKLQTTGISAADYLTVFQGWESSGDMAFYRTHFLLDDVHWIWYAGFFTVLLCRLFEVHRVAHKHDWVLLLPLASGLLDWYENRLQHVFLGAPDFATIIDPLPLFSTLASDVKWGFSLVYIVLSAFLLARLFFRERVVAEAG